MQMTKMMMAWGRGARFLTTGGVLAMAVATAAMAEEAPSTAPEQTGSEDIVVTAQKREEKLLSTPVPVTAISATALTQQGAVNIRDYFPRVPGLSINARGNGRLTVVLRGISTGSGNNPTTAITIDDVPIGSSTSAGIGDALMPEIDPSDLQRIEVLRGPQGTLYGASSLGGLLKYVTKAPDTESFGGRGEVSGSSVAHGDFGFGGRLSVNVPIVTDVAALRVSGFYRQDPGFVDDPLQGKKNVNENRVKGGRADLLVKLSPDVSLRLGALLQNGDGDGSQTEDVTIAYVPATGRYEHRRLPGTDVYSSRLRVYSGILNADLGGVTATSVTAFSKLAHDGPQDVSPTFGRFGPLLGLSFTPGALITNVNRTNKFSQEIRFASNGDGPLDWLIGGYVTREKGATQQSVQLADLTTGAPLSTVPSLQDVDNHSTYREISGFGSLTYHFTDQFDVQVGGRYASIRQRLHSFTTGALASTTTEDQRATDKVFTFLVTPRYRINSDLMVYARVASGYRPGGANSAVVDTNPSYDADRTVNYELGFKGQLIDRVLTLDASLFDIEWKDIQLRQVAATGFSYYGNSGKARSRGVEITSTLTPATGLSIAGNLAYTDATLRNASTSGIIAAVGDRLPYSPKWAGSVAVDQRFTLTDDAEGFAGATLAYVGERAADFATRAGTPRFRMPGYTTIDLRVGATMGNWTVTAYLKNLTDKLGYTAGNPRDAITRTGLFDAGLIDPRTVGVSIARDF